MWFLAALALLRAPPAGNARELLFGGTWSFPARFYIAALSVPGSSSQALLGDEGIGTDRAPRLPGAASGLLAGALGASIYALPLPRKWPPPFLGIWYLAGMLIPARYRRRRRPSAAALVVFGPKPAPAPLRPTYAERDVRGDLFEAADEVRLAELHFRCVARIAYAVVA